MKNDRNYGDYHKRSGKFIYGRKELEVAHKSIIDYFETLKMQFAIIDGDMKTFNKIKNKRDWKKAHKKS